MSLGENLKMGFAICECCSWKLVWDRQERKKMKMVFCKGF